MPLSNVSKPKLESLTPADWATILKNIRTDIAARDHESFEEEWACNCILVLGPEALVDRDNQPLQEMLCKKVLEALGQHPGEEVPGDQFFEVMQKMEHHFGTKFEGAWDDFSRQVFLPDSLNDVYLEKLPFIPIPLIINTSPDKTLYQAFKRANVDVNFLHYNFNGNQQQTSKNIPRPTAASPLIYNLFGICDDINSLVLSQDNLLEYIFSILTNRQVPQTIINLIRNAKNKIFLGFDFESWHLKIILRLFEMHDKNIKRSAFASPWRLEKPETAAYYQQKFHINFISANIPVFIEELYAECEKDPEIKFRNEIKVEKKELAGAIQQLVAENKIIEAIKIIEDHAREKNNRELLKNGILLAQQYRNLIQDRRLSTNKSESELAQVENKIMLDILDIAFFIDA